MLPVFSGHYQDLGISSLKRYDSACNLILIMGTQMEREKLKALALENGEVAARDASIVSSGVAVVTVGSAVEQNDEKKRPPGRKVVKEKSEATGKTVRATIREVNIK